MHTNNRIPLSHILADGAVFDCTRALYRRDELADRHDYLIDTTQDWSDSLKQELSALQYLLHKVPQTNNGTTHIISASYRHDYCKNMIAAFICADDAFVAKYFDLDAIAEKVATAMPRFELCGHVFYWFNRTDL